MDQVRHIILQYLPYNEYVDNEIKSHFPDDYIQWRAAQVSPDGRVNRIFHSLDDMPAMCAGDFKVWYRNGKIHRLNGPAVINGTRQTWYQNDERHRVDGPAVIDYNRYEWYQNGKLHRTDGPALVVKDYEWIWYQHGILHRLDGPAIIRNDYQAWYQNGKLLRAFHD